MRLLLLISMLFTYGLSSGQGILEIKSNNIYRLTNYTTYALDSSVNSQNPFLNSTFRSEFNPEWIKTWPGNFWVRFEIKNTTLNPNYILTLDLWEQVTLYYMEGDSLIELRSGTETNIYERPELLHRLITFPVQIPSGTQKAFIVKLKSNFQLNRNYAYTYRFINKTEIQEARSARRGFMVNQVRVVLILGLAIGLIFYNAGLWVFNRKSTYLLLSIYLLVLVLHLANIHGIVTLYFFPALGGREMLAGIIGAHLITIMQATIIYSLFRFKRNQAEFWILGGLLLFYLFTLTYSIISSEPIWFYPRKIIDVLGFTTVLLLAIRRKQPGGKFVLIAMSMTMITGSLAEVLSTVMTFTILNTGLLYQAGVTIQMVLFTLGTANLMSRTEKAFEQSEEDKQRIIRQQNENLKELVNDRTQQLMETLNALRTKTSELELVNRELSEKNEEISNQAESITRANNEILILNASLEKLVNQRTRELENAVRELDTFLYQSSHNLRRPLTTLLGLTNLISMEAKSEGVDSLILRSRETIYGLDSMLKKLTMIKYCLDPHYMEQTVDVLSTMHAALDGTTRRFEKLILHAEVPEHEPFYITCTPELIRSIFECIFENAIQYKLGDAVEITVSYENIPGYMVIAITDNGTGIQEVYMDRVFEMFYRANETSSGNGLGLYIVHRGMLALDGYVQVNSTFGRGTKISLFFKL